MTPLIWACFGRLASELPGFSSGSSLHPDLRGLSLPSSPSFTPNAPTVLCGGKSEPNLNMPLNVSLNSSLNSNYHTTLSSSTGRSTSPLALMVTLIEAETRGTAVTLPHLSNVQCLFSPHLRHNPQLSLLQPPRVPHLPVLLDVVERRVHHLLRERCGHGPLLLWTHVSVLHLRPQAQENGQRVLPHLQEDNQRHHKDLPEHVGLVVDLVTRLQRLSKP